MVRNPVHATFVPRPASFNAVGCISAILKGCRGRGWLDSLFSRCLSSYLFFPPDPGTQSAVAGIARRGAMVTRAPLQILSNGARNLVLRSFDRRNYDRGIGRLSEFGGTRESKSRLVGNKGVYGPCSVRRSGGGRRRVRAFGMEFPIGPSG